MSDGLMSLLGRVHAAGGPVEVNASGEVAFVQLSPRCEVTLDLEADSREQPRNDALLIHALRLDAAQRGLFVHAVGDYTAQGAGFTVWLEPHPERSRGDHETEACAWLLAWLDAFEEPE